MPEKRPKLDQAPTTYNPTRHHDRREVQRRERCRRLLETDLRKYVKRASELQFDYQAASKIARRGKSTPIA